MDAKMISVNSADVSYYDSGKGESVVLLHGFAGSKDYWKKIFPRLAEGYRVIVPDLPGHGASGMAADHYSIEEMAEVVNALLEKLSIEKATMFGHSMGGYVTLAFAEMYPDRLRGFSLVHSTALADSDEAKDGRESNARKVLEEGFEGIMAGLSQKLFSPDNTEKNANDIKEIREIGVNTPVKGIVSALLAMKERPDRKRLLETTDLPVLLVAGEKDQIIPSENTFLLERPGIQQELIEGAGHMSMYEQPEELIRIMKGFLDDIHQ